jgi:hypothetical protein
MRGLLFCGKFGLLLIGDSASALAENGCRRSLLHRIRRKACFMKRHPDISVVGLDFKASLQ